MVETGTLGWVLLHSRAYSTGNMWYLTILRFWRDTQVRMLALRFVHFQRVSGDHNIDDNVYGVDWDMRNRLSAMAIRRVGKDEDELVFGGANQVPRSLRIIGVPGSSDMLSLGVTSNSGRQPHSQPRRATQPSQTPRRPTPFSPCCLVPPPFWPLARKHTHHQKPKVKALRSPRALPPPTPPAPTST